jgi:putative transposase
VKFRFIAAEKAHHSLSQLCRCLRVARSGFYAWQRHPESAHAQRDRKLKVLVHASFTASKHCYDSRAFTGICSSKTSASAAA